MGQHFRSIRLLSHAEGGNLRKNGNLQGEISSPFHPIDFTPCAGSETLLSWEAKQMHQDLAAPCTDYTKRFIYQTQYTSCLLDVENGH